MRLLGPSEIGHQAQDTVRDAPRFADVLGVEQDGALLLYTPSAPSGKEAWRSVYSLWARITPVPERRETYRLDHLALDGQWQELDVEGSLAHCITAIADNKYHLFFG